MGVPDFLRFVTRNAPGALAKLPQGPKAAPLVYDFILIDATNAFIKVKPEALLDFLSPSHVQAKRGIIFALDSQRNGRTDTNHFMGRRAQVQVGELDVQVQQFCTKLADIYHKTMPTGAPSILTSGRAVVGEADYKIMDIHRFICTAALAEGDTELPSMLVVSEDSDVLCGALCGPAPHRLSIATNVQDILQQLSILRVDRVLAYVAKCTDAFYGARSSEEKKFLDAQEELRRSAAEAAAQPETANKPAPNDTEVDPLEDDDEGEEQKTTMTAPPPMVDDEAGRRKKKDGPMVATGVRIKLDDSSSDDEGEKDDSKKGANLEAALAGGEEEEQRNAPLASAGYADSTPSADCVTPYDISASVIASSSCRDLVFLFLLVMGNSLNVPPLLKGVTKVDAESCWQAYCKHKYQNLSLLEEKTGRSLLSPVPVPSSTVKSVKAAASGQGYGRLLAGYYLDCKFLYAILDELHYADTESRPPGEEERDRAFAYLSSAAYAMLRYTVGCHLTRDTDLKQSFLDTRSLNGTQVVMPSVSAVKYVLGQQASHVFILPMEGLVGKSYHELVTKDAAAAILAAGQARESATVKSAPGLELSVTETLQPTTTSSLWAVRGPRSRAVALETILRSGSVPSGGRFATSSVGSLLGSCLGHLNAAEEQPMNPNDLFLTMAAVWRHSLLDWVVQQRRAIVEEMKRRGELATVAGVTGKISHGRGLAGSKAAPTMVGRNTYSFELRRMAPVLLDGSAPNPSTEAPVEERKGSPSDASSLILRATLGISYDYAAAQPEPKNLATLPRSVVAAEDAKEIMRLRRVAKRERVIATTLNVVQRSKQTDEKEDTLFADAPSKPAVARKRRLGKAERAKLREKRERDGESNEDNKAASPPVKKQKS